jgi:hypothetical protein
MSGARRESRTRSPPSSAQRPQRAVGVGSSAILRVRTVGGQAGIIDTMLVPASDMQLLRERVDGKRPARDPIILFTNKCRPVICMHTKDIQTCYFEGDTMQPIALLGDCAPGDPTDAKLWFQDFLTACVGPMTRLLAHSEAKQVTLRTEFSASPFMSLQLEAGKRASLICCADNGGEQYIQLSRSLQATRSSDIWQGEPTPKMVLLVQQLLEKPVPLRTAICEAGSLEAVNVSWRELGSQWHNGAGTIQLLVPRYVDKIRE